MQKGGILKTILVIGGAIAIYSIAQASRFLNGLKIEFSNISIGGNLLNPRVFITLKIFNPTPVSVTVSNLTGQLLYNNKFFANVQSIDEQIIPAAQIVYFDLDLQSNLTDVLKTVNLLLTNKIANNFVFDGTLKVNGVQLPYKGKLNW